MLASLQPEESHHQAGRRVDIQRWYDPTTSRINKRITLHENDRPPRTYLESVRAYTKEEVTIGLSWAGLDLTALYGNFQGDPYDRDSERLILVGRRPR